MNCCFMCSCVLDCSLSKAYSRLNPRVEYNANSWPNRFTLFSDNSLSWTVCSNEVAPISSNNLRTFAADFNDV